MGEAAQEKGEHWGEEDLTSMDIKNLVPLVEKEKGQRGGDLWGEPEMILNLNHNILYISRSKA